VSTLTIVLWGVTFVLIVVGVGQVWYLWPSQRPERDEKMRGKLNDAVEGLGGCPQLGELTEQVVPLYMTARRDELISSCPSDDWMMRAISAIDGLPEAKKSALEQVGNQAVNNINRFAELVDAGLVLPKDLVRFHRDLHEALLVETALIEPFVWYRSLVGGMGRWGLRPLQLRELLLKLRASSRDPKVKRAIFAETRSGERLCVAEPKSVLWNTGVGFANHFRTRTISRPTKLRIKRRRRGLERKFTVAGMIPSPERETVLW
jgi:hypothetical protein